MFRLGPQSSHTRCPHSHTGTRLFFVEADRTFHLLTQMPFETLVDHDKHAQTHFNNAYDLGSWQQLWERSPTWRHEAARWHLGVVDALGLALPMDNLVVRMKRTALR